MVDCVTGYINFCVDKTIPTSEERCFPNNKPWITSEKKRVFRRGYKEEVKRIQKELNRKLKEGKDSYRQKLDDKLQRNKVKEVWSGMRENIGLRQPAGVIESGPVMADRLNQFFLTGLTWILQHHNNTRPPTVKEQ